MRLLGTTGGGSPPRRVRARQRRAGSRIPPGSERREPCARRARPPRARVRCTRAAWLTRGLETSRAAPESAFSIARLSFLRLLSVLTPRRTPWVSRTTASCLRASEHGDMSAVRDLHLDQTDRQVPGRRAAVAYRSRRPLGARPHPAIVRLKRKRMAGSVNRRLSPRSRSRNGPRRWSPSCRRRKEVPVSYPAR